MSSVNTTDEVVGEIVSIEGVVKWFDPVKGYGFIVPNDGGVDVLVHHSTLRRGGYDILYPQARIKCAIIQRQQGFQADKIIAVDNSEAIIPTGNPRPTAILSDITDVSDFQQAEVKWFNRVRGFGFVNVEPDGQDIFGHMEVLRKAGIEALVPGQYVLVRFGNGPEGLMATDVKRIDSGMALAGIGDDNYLQEGDEQPPLVDDAPPATDSEASEQTGSDIDR
ncbi:cold shock domain-containing protein [Alphaproteobacteria bacterium]|nr:cold shock domain-containing protein [Alphaproteobacteria bacterium]